MRNESQGKSDIVSNRHHTAHTSANESEFKASQFNEFLGCLNGEWVIYNNLSGGLIEANQHIYDSLLNNSVGDITNGNQIKSLKYGKFIVEQNADESEELREKRDHIADSVKVIGLQILPVNGCNFKCTYCYEGIGAKIEFMPVNVMDDIIKYVKNTIKTTTEFLNVSWFGSEPLLAVDRIEYLSNAFLRLSKDNNLKYHASIITNGYLLNRGNVDRLQRCGVAACQATIDGPAGIHDRRRMLRNGGKTWEKIVGNLIYAASKSLSIGIRINIDKTNIEYIEPLINDFKKIGLYDKVNFSLGLVSKFGKVCRSVEDTLITFDKARDICDQKEMMELLDGTGKRLVRPPLALVGCVASAKNSLVVGKDGELYKCSKTVGDKNEICGDISNPDFDNPNLIKWLKPDIYSIETCKKCSMLPVCNGKGCVFDVIYGHENIFDCNQEKVRKKHIEHLINYYHKRAPAQNKKED